MNPYPQGPRKKVPQGQLWKPGATPYRDFLDSLTPEQREQHLQQRRERRHMRQAFQEVVQEYQSRWAAEMHNAAWAVLKKARDQGDAQAFAAVFDRIVGRAPENAPDAGRALPWRDEDI
jgi:hypothetical protein